MHSDAIFSSIGDSQMKKVIKNQFSSTNSVFYKQLSVQTHQTDTCESELTCYSCQMRMRNVDGAMGVFTRSGLGIPSGKTLDRNCETLYWWQAFP